MISGEYGKRITLMTGFDLSGNTQLSIEVTRPDATTLTFTKTNGVTLGVVDTTVTDERGVRYNLRANEYIFRDWQDGEINQSGKYRIRAVYNDALKELRSRQATLQVAQ